MALNIDVKAIEEGLRNEGKFEQNYGPLNEGEVQKAISILAAARAEGYNCDIKPYTRGNEQYVGFKIWESKIKLPEKPGSSRGR